MKTKEYTLSITFNVDDRTELPQGLLENAYETDALAAALVSLAKDTEFVEDLLRVNGILYGPEDCYL